MISIIISSFLHSVILANPVDQAATDSDSNSDEKTESTSDGDDEKHGSTAETSHQTAVFNEPIKSGFYNKEHCVTMCEPLQDDTHQSHDTMSSSNLTVDALSYSDRSVPTSPHKQQGPRANDERKQDKKFDDIDIRELIKQAVDKKFSNIPALTFFDAAIVYDERDYSEAMKFRNEILSLLRPRLGGDLRIELFDSEQFAQSKVMVVKDVIDRCSVVLLYLTPNFSTPELNLFVEESIAMTRLSPYDSRRQWVLKPVHTEPQRSRQYTVPTGLLSMRGINWFDKSHYTLDQIMSILNSAITERRQRETGVNTEIACQNTLRGNFELPRPQPDFPSILKVTMPPEDTHHMSQDALSFPENLRTTLPPEMPSLPANQNNSVYHQGVQQYQHEYMQHTNMNPNSPFDGTQPYTHGRAPVETYTPVMMPNFAQAPAVTTRLQYQGQAHQMLQPGFLTNSTIAQNDARYNLPYSQYVHPGGFQQPPVPMETYPSNLVYDAQPSFGAQHQHDYRQRQTSSPSSYQQRNDGFRPENTSTRPTNAHNVITTTSSPFMSNLSTDDVEIDNYADADEKSKHRKHDKRHSKKSRRNTKKAIHADIVEVDSSSDSSDDEDDVDTVVPRRSKNKIINITGCSVVQLGKGNLVTKPKSPMLPFEKPSTRNDTVTENIVIPRPGTNSISEDNMSYTSVVEGRVRQQHAPSTHWNISTDTENMCGEDNYINFTNNLTEKQLNSKSTECGDDVQQTQSHTPTKLNVTMNTVSKNTFSLEDTVNYSPDTNFNDDQLFASGPLEVKNGPEMGVPNQVKDALFTFSQTRQHVPILRHVTPINISSERTETNDDSDLD